MSSEALKPTIAFDQHSSEYREHGLAIEADLRDRCPVGWSASHGGFWALSTHQAITSVLQDKDLCSSARTVDADGNPAGGITIPSHAGYRVVPDESDPPQWDYYRKPLSRPFAPAAVALMRPQIEASTTEAINRVVTRGAADFVLDVANPITALVTLDMLGLPLADWYFYSGPVHRLPYESGHPEVQAGVAAVYRRLREVVSGERPCEPGRLAHQLIDVQATSAVLTTEDLADMLFQLIVGGFDTTASLLAGALEYLETKPVDRERLVGGDDTFWRIATEEFVRWVSPVISLARTAREDTTVAGCPVRAGDRMWLMFRSANHDETVFDNPDDLDLTRFPNRHLGFGSGIHRCLGSNLARLIFQIALRQSLIRFPDYAIDRDRAERLPNLSRVNGWIGMPITFSPGQVLDSGPLAHAKSW